MKRRILIVLTVGLISTFFVLFRPQSSMAGVHVNVGINLPLPALVIPGPPEVAVIPGTYVYLAPGFGVDIFFYHDYWYRPYRGRWYRSYGYDGPWRFIPEKRVPFAVRHLPRGYRYLPPGHERIPYGQMKKNWRDWEREKYWDRRGRHDIRAQRRETREHWREERRERRDHGRHGGRWDD